MMHTQVKLTLSERLLLSKIVREVADSAESREAKGAQSHALGFRFSVPELLELRELNKKLTLVREN